MSDSLAEITAQFDRQQRERDARRHLARCAADNELRGSAGFDVDLLAKWIEEKFPAEWLNITATNKYGNTNDEAVVGLAITLLERLWRLEHQT